MDDEEIWQLVKKPVDEFVESIKEMNIHVDKLVTFYTKHTRQQSRGMPSGQIAGNVEATNELLSPLACAKLELAIVFAINTCYWMYLITHGEDPNKNEISKDIERIRLFMNRAKEVEELQSEACPSAKRPRIDQEAAKRLCKNNMTLKSAWD